MANSHDKLNQMTAELLERINHLKAEETFLDEMQHEEILLLEAQLIKLNREIQMDQPSDLHMLEKFIQQPHNRYFWGSKHDEARDKIRIGVEKFVSFTYKLHADKQLKYLNGSKISEDEIAAFMIEQLRNDIRYYPVVNMEQPAGVNFNELLSPSTSHDSQSPALSSPPENFAKEHVAPLSPLSPQSPLRQAKIAQMKELKEKVNAFYLEINPLIKNSNLQNTYSHDINKHIVSLLRKLIRSLSLTGLSLNEKRKHCEMQMEKIDVFVNLSGLVNEIYPYLNQRRSLIQKIDAVVKDLKSNDGKQVFIECYDLIRSIDPFAATLFGQNNTVLNRIKGFYNDIYKKYASDIQAVNKNNQAPG